LAVIPSFDTHDASAAAHSVEWWRGQAEDKAWPRGTGERGGMQVDFE
jgi:hypothetical protein